MLEHSLDRPWSNLEGPLSIPRLRLLGVDVILRNFVKIRTAFLETEIGRRFLNASLGEVARCYQYHPKRHRALPRRLRCRWLVHFLVPSVLPLTIIILVGSRTAKRLDWSLNFLTHKSKRARGILPEVPAKSGFFNRL